MPNVSLYNESVYNWATWFVATTLTDDIIFNWLGLQNLNITASFKNDDNLPNIDLNTFQNPIVDGGGVLSRRYTKKDISISWRLKGADGEELNNLIDLFKIKTSAVEGFLDIKINWIYRRVKATVVSSKILDRKHYNITQVPYDITFQTLEPFFYNREDESKTDANVTGDFVTEIEYYWTAPSNPRVYFVFTTWGGTNAMTFDLNNRRLTVNETINDGDVLLFDSIEKTVKINGIEVDYTGTFPQLIYGDNSFQFEINGTPDLDITVLYATNYL